MAVAATDELIFKKINEKRMKLEIAVYLNLAKFLLFFNMKYLHNSKS